MRDMVFQDALRKGSGGWKRVVNAFGREILQDDGEVDRAALGQIVFSDPDKRQLLNRCENFASYNFHHIHNNCIVMKILMELGNCIIYSGY